MLNKIVLVSIIMLLITACGNSTQNEIQRLLPVVQQQLNQLNQSLSASKLTNAQLIKIYAALLRKSDIASFGIGQDIQDILFDASLTSQTKKTLLQYQRGVVIPAPLAYIQVGKLTALVPLTDQYHQLINQLVKEGNTNSHAIEKLQQRLLIAKDRPQELGNDEAVLDELYALISATELATYNSTLIDVVNVLANLSQGALQSINQEQKQSNAANQQPGSQLVGNPNYGSWQNQGGQSAWVWFAQYALFSSLFMRPYYYHSWYHHRPYSYYNDYGRSVYGSKKNQQASQKVHKANQSRVKRYGAANNIRRSSPPAMQNRRRVSSYNRSQRLGTRSRSRFGGK